MTRQAPIIAGTLAALVLYLCAIPSEMSTQIAAGELAVTADQIVETLEHGNHVERALALYAVTNQHWNSTDATKLVPHLARSINDRQALGEAAAAVRWLAQSHPELCKPAIATLGDAIEPRHLGDGGIRESEMCRLIVELGRLDALAADYQANLRSIVRLDEKTPYASVWAAAALTRISPDNDESLKWLQERLDTKRVNVVLAAFGEVGSRASEYLPSLHRYLDDPSRITRAVAASAISRIERTPSPKVIDVLCDAIVEEPEELALRPFGPSPPSLTHTLHVAEALGDLARRDSTVVARLVQLREKATDQQRASIDTALRQSSPR